MCVHIYTIKPFDLFHYLFIYLYLYVYCIFYLQNRMLSLHKVGIPRVLLHYIQRRDPNNRVETYILYIVKLLLYLFVYILWYTKSFYESSILLFFFKLIDYIKNKFIILFIIKLLVSGQWLLN